MFNAAETEPVRRCPLHGRALPAGVAGSRFNLDQDTRLVLSPDGKLVGCAEVWTLADPPDPSMDLGPCRSGLGGPRGRQRHDGLVAHSGTGRTATRPRSRARARQRSARDPGHAPSTALFEDFGFSLVRMSWMMKIDLATPPATLPGRSGIRLQPYRHPQDLEAVYRCVRDAFRDHWGSRGRARSNRGWSSSDTPARSFTLSSRICGSWRWMASEIAGISLCRRRVR